MTMTQTATAARFHVGLNVADLERSVRFYRTLFGTAPAKHLPDYAKFEPAESPQVLALYPSPQAAGGALNHVGQRLPDAAALVALQRRPEEAGVATQRQDGVECCYARQSKFWVTDPDRNLWEIYTFEGDLDHSGFDDPPAPAAAPAAGVVWEHRLTEPVPERIDRPAASVDEVRLEGTFNLPLGEMRTGRLLAEVYRVLRPGGKVAVHGLAADRPFPGKPDLPGLASLVRHVPVDAEVLADLGRAGFVGMYYEKLGDIHCFSVRGVELREMRLHGWWPPEARQEEARPILYKGPFESVTDDAGTSFPRGEIRFVPAERCEALRHSPAAGQFLFLPSQE
jgi:catechol 2,3-dioxygenase-like lactoylglutathione lyase family enzyme